MNHDVKKRESVVTFGFDCKFDGRRQGINHAIIYGGFREKTKTGNNV